MSEIITKINRESSFIYRVDKKGNVIKTKYNLFKDPLTLVTIAILILGSMYYLQMKSMKTNEANFEDACLTYNKLRDYWIQQHPGQLPTLDEVFSLRIDESGTITEVNNLGG